MRAKDSFCKKLEVVVTKDSKGIVNTSGYGFLVESNNGITSYKTIDICESSVFKVVGFNLYTKRVIAFLDRPNHNTEYVELDYNFILSNCNIENTNIFKGIESVIIVNTEKKIVTTDTIIKITLLIVMFLIGLSF